MPDRFALLEVLISLSKSQEKTFIVIDAIDEASRKEEILEILSIISEKKIRSLHLLVSSRGGAPMEGHFLPIATADIHIGGLSQSDIISSHIRRYLRDQPSTRAWDKSLKQEIETRLVQKAEGR